MNPICFYHKADLDGVCSAAIVKHFIPECELYGLDYGDEFPWDKVDTTKSEGLAARAAQRTVYMVDFSLPHEGMFYLAEVSNLTWLDHHKTALEANAGLRARGMRDTTRAACELAWAWMSLFPDPEKMTDSYTFEEFDVELPEAVRLLGRYDVWDKDHPEWESRILPFQYAIRSEEAIYDPECLRWRFLLGVDGYSQSLDTYIEAPWLDHAIERGAAILRYQAEVNRRACEAGAHTWTLHEFTTGIFSEDARKSEWVFVPWGESPRDYAPPHALKWERRLHVIACNTTTNNSQFFDGFFDPEKHDVMCAYSQWSDGKWKVSMYTTKDEIDCGAIAKHFGGGGHKGAAGFVCIRLPWDTE